MSENKKPKQAATVILLKRCEPSGFEVFLTRRADSMPFLGGMYCFPGGTVHNDDCSEAMQSCCHGVTPKQARGIAGAQFKPREALGFWVAAIRELFEETGVLLARRPDATPAIFDSAQTFRLQERQRALLAKSLSFRELLEQENLQCDLATLAYFSHWQTPSQVSMRFDTRFFVTLMPDNQRPLSTSPEVTDSIWITPDRALQLFATNELPMIFPTVVSLRTLADFDSLKSVFKEFSNGEKKPKLS